MAAAAARTSSTMSVATRRRRRQLSPPPPLPPRPRVLQVRVLLAPQLLAISTVPIAGQGASGSQEQQQVWDQQQQLCGEMERSGQVRRQHCSSSSCSCKQYRKHRCEHHNKKAAAAAQPASSSSVAATAKKLGTHASALGPGATGMQSPGLQERW